MSKRDYESAIVELRLAILQNPASPEEHRYLGQALLLVHRQPEAVRELRLAVQLDPDSPLWPITIWRPLFLTARIFRGGNRISAGAAPAAYGQQPLLPVRLPDEHGAL